MKLNSKLSVDYPYPDFTEQAKQVRAPYTSNWNMLVRPVRSAFEKIMRCIFLIDLSN